MDQSPVCGEPKLIQQISDAAGVVPLQEHSNANLLKVDTHDVYSTANSLKKMIAKHLPAGQRDPPPQPLLTGLVRFNKNPKNPFLFMAFETPEDRANALILLEKLVTRGKPWTEAAVTARDLELTHKGQAKRRREMGDEEDGDTKRSKLTQYNHLSMEEQLDRKKKHCLGVMKGIVPSHIYGHDAAYDRFVGILTCPVTEGYRNHVNLSFGFSADGAAALGFQAGSVLEGTAAILPATLPDSDVVTMSAAAKAVAVAVMEVYAEFHVAEKGGLEMFDKVKMTGFWRKLQVRQNVLGEVMIDLEVDTASTTAEVIAAVRVRLVEMLTSLDLRAKLVATTGLSTVAVVSVQWHSHTGIGSLPFDAPRDVLSGSATLTETVAGLSYELSPTAFFQVNTPGMEVMLNKVTEVAELSSGTTLLDLCSGTGTIGLTLAKHVKRVIGIELVESAVVNARRNAERNGVTNAVFHCGRVENLLPELIRGLSPEDRSNIVAILDPPRAGVSPIVMKWIRGTETIRKVVYISCEQKALVRDCPGLTKPTTKTYRGAPFAVTAAFAVDLFPHTHHVEMVAVLTRIPEAVAEAEEAVAEDGLSVAKDAEEDGTLSKSEPDE